MDDDRGRGEELDRVRRAHERLLTHLDDLTGSEGADPALPSLLPGWTRGHLLTHIAGNARSFQRQLEGAERGESVERYPGGVAFRDAELEQGATRTWPELVDDVRTSAEQLDAALAAQTRWDIAGLNPDGTELPATDVPFRREREVLVHHADLGDPGFTAADWPDRYVRDELRRMEMVWNARKPMGATVLPPLALDADPRTRLQWLLGRTDIDGLDPAGIF